MSADGGSYLEGFSGDLGDTDTVLGLESEEVELVYHYTRAAGLLGIFSSCRLWATHMRYLNDSLEFELISQLLDEVARERGDNDEPARRVARMVSEGSHRPRIENFVCSFSVERDQLSLWQSYAPFGEGYALGFSVEALRQSPVPGWEFMKAHYEHSIQEHVVGNIFDSTCDAYTWCQDRGADEQTARSESADYLAGRIGRYGPILKNRDFSAEREWRLISPRIPFEDSAVHYREATWSIVPYVCFPDSQSDFLDTALKCIVVGPGPQQALAAEAVTGLLQTRNLTEVKVATSRISLQAV